jgi:hypothetical protein
MLRALFLSFALLLAALPGAGRAAEPYVFDSIDGGRLDLRDWQGRPVLVVNTASRCGFTGQYEGLQDLQDRYGARGLVVLAVPSDDFRQELDSAAAVKDYCETVFGLTLPMTDITPAGSRRGISTSCCSAPMARCCRHGVPRRDRSRRRSPRPSRRRWTDPARSLPQHGAAPARARRGCCGGAGGGGHAEGARQTQAYTPAAWPSGAWRYRKLGAGRAPCPALPPVRAGSGASRRPRPRRGSRTSVRRGFR